MYKAYKFRLYPDNNQEELINKNFGCNRFVYNYYLDKIKKDKYMSATLCIKDYTSRLKYEFPFLQEADSILILKIVLKDIITMILVIRNIEVNMIKIVMLQMQFMEVIKDITTLI